MVKKAYVDSAVGIWVVVEEQEAICELEYVGTGSFPLEQDTTPLLRQATQQLKEYFQGERKEFSLPLHTQGTPFQEMVWAALRQIPYGETCSYQDIAKKIGRPKAMRAVGGANHQNPISIFIPCHRVIGQKGDLVGYGGGLQVKAFLLDLEKTLGL
jgi:O-6-methylguanine DNA methyltransferase